MSYSDAPDDRREQELDPRFIAQQRLAGRLAMPVVVLVTLAVLLIVFAAADDLPRWGRVAIGLLWALAMAGLIWKVERWPAREYAHARYALGEDGLLVRRGVYWRTVSHVPRSRVQHTDVSQGPLERRYGLGTLVVYTAGTDHARLAVPGLAHETAQALRDELRRDHHDDVV